MEIAYLPRPSSDRDVSCDRDIVMAIYDAEKDWIDQIQNFIKDDNLPACDLSKNP